MVRAIDLDDQVGCGVALRSSACRFADSPGTVPTQTSPIASPIARIQLHCSDCNWPRARPVHGHRLRNRLSTRSPKVSPSTLTDSTVRTISTAAGHSCHQ